MMKKSILAAVGLLAVTIAYQPVSLASDVGTITVEGVAHDTYRATQSVVSVTNKTERNTVLEAKNDNDKVSEDFKNMLHSLGILDKDIRTSKYEITDRQYRIGDTDTFRTTYVVTNTVDVTMNDIGKTSYIINAAAKAGISDVRLSKLDLNTVAKDAQRQKLLVLAAKDARTKADAIAAALGTRVVGVDSLVVDDNYNYNPRMYRAVNFAAKSDMMDSASAIENGENTEDLHINVVFKVK